MVSLEFFVPIVTKHKPLSLSGDWFEDLAATCGGFLFNLRVLFQNRVRPAIIFSG